MHRTAVDRKINYVRSEKQKEKPHNNMTFDFVSHEWLIKSLHLVKLPEDLTRAIKNITSQWCNVLHLKGEEEVIVSDIIYFSKGIFQGESHSVLLFFCR